MALLCQCEKQAVVDNHSVDNSVEASDTNTDKKFKINFGKTLKSVEVPEDSNQLVIYNSEGELVCRIMAQQAVTLQKLIIHTDSENIIGYSYE